jgi:putative DNA methylase
VSREALNMIFKDSDVTGFEEDARLTAMWLWTLSTNPDTDASVSVDEDTASDDDDEASAKTIKPGGYVLEYDAARKIAQGLGAHLEQLKSLIEVKGNKARLLPVRERLAYLVGSPSAAPVPVGRKSKKAAQPRLFEAVAVDIETTQAEWGELDVPEAGITSLDRVHQSMLLFNAGRGEALKRFLVENGAGTDQRFWKLAQALSALYPAGSDEKRWVDGVLARKKGLGF